jgi:hypothetical protein
VAVFAPPVFKVQNITAVLALEQLHSSRRAAPEQMDYQEDNRQHQEQMNPSGGHVKGQPAHQPHRQQNKKKEKKNEFCEDSHRLNLQPPVHGSGQRLI